jgi:hypothetical protein
MPLAPVFAAPLALLLLVAEQSAAPAPEKLAADSPRTTAAGSTFTAPAGWSITARGNVVILVPPEADSRLAIVELGANDSAAAAAAAWAAYRPEAKWPMKLSTPRAPQNGWEERDVLDYETSPNERVTVYAIAERAGASWTVAIVDATDPTYEIRAAQFRLVTGSLRPKGYARERFSEIGRASGRERV